MTGQPAITRTSRLAAVLLVWALLVAGALPEVRSPQMVQAQNQPPSGAWSEAEVVFSTPGWTFNVATSTDSQGQLLAIWQYNPYKKAGEEATLSDNQNDSLYLGHFDSEGWSTPAEVLLGAIGASRLAVVTDHGGKLHVFSHNTCLWHAAADLDQIDRPQAWSEPVCLADGASSWPAVTVSADGRINLLFSEPSARDILFAYSEDGGESWGETSVATRYDNPALGLTNLALAEGTGGTLHAAWAQVPLPDGYPPTSVMYARSGDRGLTWSTPVELAGEHQGEPVIVADGLGRVHVAWNGDASDGGRYYVHSLDGGLSWQPVEEILRGGGGLQYPPALVVDASGVVHGLFTNETAIVYAMREEWGWEPAEELLGPETVLDPDLLAEIDSARLQLTDDNMLHAMYSRFNFGEVLHQWRLIDAPAETRATAVPPPTLVPAVPPASTVQVETPTETRTPKPTTVDIEPQAELVSGSISPLALSVVPVLALLALVVGLSIRRRR